MKKINKCAFDETRECNDGCMAYNTSSTSPYMCDRMNAFDQSLALENVSKSIADVVSALDLINVPI